LPLTTLGSIEQLGKLRERPGSAADACDHPLPIDAEPAIWGTSTRCYGAVAWMARRAHRGQSGAPVRSRMGRAQGFVSKISVSM
jgi:hypothetical protein